MNMTLNKIKNLIGVTISKETLQALQKSKLVENIENLGSPDHLPSYEKYKIILNDGFDFCLYTKIE